MAADRKRMSKEKHEIRYAKTLAVKELNKTKRRRYNHFVIIKVGALKRICGALVTLYKNR